MQIAGSDKMQIIKFISLKEMLTYMGLRSCGRNFVIEKEIVYEFNKSFSSNFQTIKLFCKECKKCKYYSVCNNILFLKGKKILQLIECDIKVEIKNIHKTFFNNQEIIKKKPMNFTIKIGENKNGI